MSSLPTSHSIFSYLKTKMDDQRQTNASPSPYRNTDPMPHEALRPIQHSNTDPIQHQTPRSNHHKTTSSVSSAYLSSSQLQRTSAPTFATQPPQTRSWYVYVSSNNTMLLKEQPLNSPLRDLHTFIRLYAGAHPGATSFDLHRDKACQHSPVLNEFFSSIFPGDKMHEYRLSTPDIDNVVVSLLIYWFYNPTLNHILDMNFLTSIVGKGRKTAILVRLWVLADQLEIPTLQNQTIFEIDALCEKENFTATECVRYVYANTKKGSALRRFFRDQCAWGLKNKWIRDNPDQFPKECLIEMLGALDDFVVKTGKRESMKPHRRMGQYLDPLTMPSEVIEEVVEGQEERIPGNNIHGGEQGGGEDVRAETFTSLDQNAKWRRQNDGFMR